MESSAQQGQTLRENLALAFQELLTAISRLRAGRQQVSDPELFRSQIKEALRTAEQTARSQSYTADDVRLGAFAVVALLDETVLNSQQPAFRDWPRRPLQEELFGEHVAGEAFFRNLEQLLRNSDSPRTIDVLEVYQLCLLLGYRGRYSAGGSGNLQAITEAVDQAIRRSRQMPPEITDAWRLPNEQVAHKQDPWVKRLTWAAGGLAVLVVISWILYKLLLGSGYSTIQSMASRGGM